MYLGGLCGGESVHVMNYEDVVWMCVGVEGWERVRGTIVSVHGGGYVYVRECIRGLSRWCVNVCVRACLMNDQFDKHDCEVCKSPNMGKSDRYLRFWETIKDHKEDQR